MKTTRASKIAGVLALVLVATLIGGCGGGETPAPKPGKPDAAGTAAQTSKPAAQGPMGSATIRGTVEYKGKVPNLKTVKMDGDPGCGKKHSEPVKSEILVLGAGNTMGNVLVQVKSGASGTYLPPSEPAVLNQEGCRYVPHVMGLMAGQAVKVLNSDGLLHNVHALPDKNKEFNKAMPATVTETMVKFDVAEKPFKIKCDVHPWMGAYVAVFDHPFFDVTGDDGGFTLAGLPAGDYEIEAWHEKLGTATESVTVSEGGTADIQFTFGG